jgi:UDP-N-acetylmuramoylalanine--D-glutamate ligase
MHHYVDIKKTIIRYQTADDLVLLNYDDPQVRLWREEIRGRAAWFTLGEELPGSGIFVQRGTICIMKDRNIIPLFPLDIIKMVGEHQKRNILPAIYLAFCSGIRIDSIKMHLTSLSGAQHRLELVREFRGVTYINDSASTIPDATIAALKAFSDKHIVLIIGGSDKRLNFEKLAQITANSHVSAYVFLPGNATARLHASIKAAHHTPIPMIEVESMPEAVIRASELAEQGDIVLLSPGTTSFGLFRHEFDRGDQFKDTVSKLGL